MKRLMEEYDNYALSISVRARKTAYRTFSVQKKSLTAW